jgi:uracil phosphoribosyltransferase
MLHVLRHPLAAHALTQLRAVDTPPAAFRAFAHQVGLLLALESTRDLPLRPHTVHTPLEPHLGDVLAQGLVVVPILRAGLGLVQPYLDLQAVEAWRGSESCRRAWYRCSLVDGGTGC